MRRVGIGGWLSLTDKHDTGTRRSAHRRLSLASLDKAMDRLKLENLRLTQQVKDLEGAVKEMNEALRESTKLLLKTRPARPAIPHERKLLVAAAQKWRCANPYGKCLLHQLGTGLFDESLFECDHIEPYSKSFRSVGNLACVCAYCHNIKSRLERLEALEDEEE
jgi:chaperonin cofactor prefoldin